MGKCELTQRAAFATSPIGHCSVRDPVDPNSFFVNPQSKSFAHFKQSNLVRCSVEDGSILEGDYPVDASATSIHSQIYRARGRGPLAEGGSAGGVEAIVHVHGPYSKGSFPLVAYPAVDAKSRYRTDAF